MKNLSIFWCSLFLVSPTTASHPVRLAFSKGCNSWALPYLDEKEIWETTTKIQFSSTFIFMEGFYFRLLLHLLPKLKNSWMLCMPTHTLVFLFLLTESIPFFSKSTKNWLSVPGNHLMDYLMDYLREATIRLSDLTWISCKCILISFKDSES